MPFDGIMTCAVTEELKRQILGGRVDKVYQPEGDEVILQIRVNAGVKRLLIAAGPSNARMGLTLLKPETPLSPPGFCMLLRKHLSGAKITDIVQYHFDRIVEIRFSCLNEMGDSVVLSLFTEMMGRHSNLILVDEERRIIDAMRHVGVTMSSIRQIEPGLAYALPTHNHKADPERLLRQSPDLATFNRLFCAEMSQTPGAVSQALYQTFNGLSPLAAEEVMCRAGAIEPRRTFAELQRPEQETLGKALRDFLEEQIKAAREPGSFSEKYVLYLDQEGKIQDFSLTPYRCCAGLERRTFPELSQLLDSFYQRRSTVDKIAQKSQDLRHILKNNLERAEKKLSIQENQLLDTKDREKYRLSGDLVTASLYQLKPGMTQAELVNFMSESQEKVVIRLDPQLTPAQNAQKFYTKYNKLKRTEAAVTAQKAQTLAEIDYLKGIENSLDMADCEQDLEDIRSDLHENGYLRKPGGRSKNLKKSKPISFVTSEGVKGSIGKNNRQNDELTFRMARDHDLWFHVQGRPGSHVILFVQDLKQGIDYTEKSLLEAAAQAGLHSSAKEEGTLAVDYTFRLYVKKPAGARAGFVRYTHQQTIHVRASEMDQAKKQLSGSHF